MRPKAKENAQEFIEELNKRGITRLVHFTPFENITAIVGEQQIIPRDKLHNISFEWRELVTKNPKRFDNPSYLNTSIMHPNVYLLDIFRRWNPSRRFCVMGINPKYIYESRTEFSTTNATYQVALRGNSIEHFRCLFSPQIRSRRNREYVIIDRADGIASCYPTDYEAEVLIQAEIPYTNILFIACRDEFERDLLASAFDVLKLPQDKLCVEPKLFRSR